MGALRYLTILAILAAIAYGPISRQITILGIFEKPAKSVLTAAEQTTVFKIADTVHCEDVHHYRPADQLFLACEDQIETRFAWFPPLGHFGGGKLPVNGGREMRGSLHVVDPKTLKSTRLAFEDFQGEFVTHGIDVIPDPQQADAVYIFAVNHLPNPDYQAGSKDIPKARSQIELFHHVLNTKTAKHVRSIRHPLITTPNDIYAESPSSIYVTNDHFYREGTLRLVEDVLPTSRWSSIVHVQIERLEPKSTTNAEAAIDASVALTGLHNNNGLGHGPSSDEVIITSAMGGSMYRATQHRSNHTLSIIEEIPVRHQIDNPSYYADPYRTASNDASGYLSAGLTRPVDLPKTGLDPKATDGARVWYARPKATAGAVGATEWETRLLYEDDGTTIRSASAAILVPIAPKAGEGKKAWLFVTGFLSESMVAVKVDL